MMSEPMMQEEPAAVRKKLLEDRKFLWDLDARSEPRYRSWEDMAADDAGKPRFGEL